jgi:hypothetical protein
MGLNRNPSASMYCDRLVRYGATEGIFVVTHDPKSTRFMILLRFSLLSRLSDANMIENNVVPVTKSSGSAIITHLCPS